MPYASMYHPYRVEDTYKTLKGSNIIALGIARCVEYNIKNNKAQGDALRKYVSPLSG